MSSKTISQVAGFVIGAVLIGIGIATGNVGLIIQGGAMIVTQAIVDLTMPKAPARQASEMTIALGEQPRVMMVGESFTPGSLVDGFNYGGKYGTDWEVLIIRLADHKCHSLTGYYVNDEFNAYTGDGPVGRYNDKLEIYFRSDTTNQTIASVVTDEGPGWTSADVGESGCDVVVAYKADKPDAKHPVWPGGRPRFGFVLKGKLCYDPRLDDTVPGGAGDHRWDDPDTWEWSENAAVCRYNWVRGVYANDNVTEQSDLLIGRGLTAEEAPPENIFAAANLCDEISCEVLPYDSKNAIQDLIASFLTPSRTRLVTAYSSLGVDYLQIIDLASRTRIAEVVSTPGPTGYDFGPDSETTFYALGDGGLSYYNLNGTHTVLTTDFGGNIPAGVQYKGGKILVLPNSGTKIGYYSGGTSVLFVDVGFHVTSTIEDTSGNAWVAGPVGSGGDIGISQWPFTVVHTVHTGSNNEVGAMDNGQGQFFVLQASSNAYLIDKTTFTIAHTSAATDSSGESGESLRRDFNVPLPGGTFVWVRFSEWDTQTGELIRTVDPTDWKATSSSFTIYDPVNNAIISRETFTSTDATWRFLDRHGGYRVAGPIYANQEYLEVEEMFALATAGNVITREGSVELEPGQAKSVVASFTDDDLLVGAEVQWNQGFLSESNSEWVNTVVARYVEPAQHWEDHAAPVLRDTDDILADGKPREASISLRLVRYQPQALRVAEVARRMGRIWGRANVKLGPRFCELEEGDWVDWTSDRYFGGATGTFRIESYSIDEKWQIALTLRQIDASVFECAADDWPTDLSQIPPPPVIPPVGAPESDNWALAAVTLSSAGSSAPALEITGSADDDDYAEAIVFEYWKDDGVIDPVASPDSAPWITFGRLPPDTTKVDISSVVPGATYYAAVSYIVDGEAGDRLVLGPVTVAGATTTANRTADTTLVTADSTLHTADLA